MIIQLNADKNLTIHQEYQDQLTENLNKELVRYSDHISRVEVHFTDENGSKEGQNDKRCLLEARMEGRPPIAVTNFGQTYDLAIKGATDKLKNALSTIVSKIKSN